MTRPPVSLMLICLLWLSRQGDLLAAPTIHKCVGADGTASYQTFACARPEQQVWSRQVAASAPSARSAPEGLRSDGESKLRYGKHASAGKRRSPASTSQAALIPLDPKGATPACLSARRQREDSLSRVGLKRTYAQLQKLDERVQRACY